MSITYEFEWQNVLNNIAYPFEQTPPLETNIVLDLCINLTSRVYLRRIECRPSSFDIYIARSSDDFEVAVAENVTYNAQDIELLNTVTGAPIGYMQLGEGIEIFKGTLQTQLFTAEETQFEYWSNSNTDIVQTINDINEQEVIFEEGYNMNIAQLSDNSLRFLPEIGRGLGEFCGQPIFLDAIYNINGVIPDSRGNIEFTHANQFLINLDNDNNTVIWSLSIPESRLDCERAGGFIGADGFKGATGPTGATGISADSSCISFDTTGLNGAFGGCCECDTQEDFCEEGDIAELSPEEVLAELGIAANDGSIDPELLELLGITVDE